MKALMAAPTEPAELSVKDLERIFRENHAMVFRAAYRITGNANDAEDVLQTVFLRMVKRDTGAEPVGNMPSFLHRSAVNAALDLVRARQNIRHIPLDELEPVLAEPASRSPERAHNSNEIRTGCAAHSPGSIPGSPRCSPSASLRARITPKSRACSTPPREPWR